MTDNFNQTLAAAVRKLMYPLVKILLRNGVPYGLLADLLRHTYVDVAYREFAPRGKKQTVSRVSALTGLTRKEVSRLLHEDGRTTAANHAHYSRAVRVISGWLNDTQFLDDNGRPALLSLEGERGSFAALVRQYSGDIPTMAMLSMLEEAGSVSVLDGKVRLVRHAYVPGGDVSEKIKILGSDVAELIASIDHNLESPAAERYFQRKVASASIAPASVEKLRTLSAERAQMLLEELDREYTAHEVDADDESRYISLGIYYYEH